MRYTDAVVSLLFCKTMIETLLRMGFRMSLKYAIILVATWASCTAVQVAAGPLHDAVRAENPNAI